MEHRLISSTCLLLIGIATVPVAAAGLHAGDIVFDAAVDPRPSPAGLDWPVTRSVTFKLESRAAQPVSGKVILGYPKSLDPSGKATKVLPFKLDRSRRLSIVTSLALPKGTGPGQYAFPVEVEAGGKRYLDMDLLVAKSVSWLCVGPFPGGVESSFDRAFPPEKKVDLKGAYAGIGGRKIGWKPFPGSAIGQDGMFQFHTIFPGLKEATAYATTTIYAPAATRARLLLGSDDSIKVWQNGRLIHANKVLRGSAPGQDKVNITLAKGRNIFLLKIGQLDGGWGFHFAIDDGKERPVAGLKYDIALCRSFITDPNLRLAEVTRTGATVTWQSDVPTTSTIKVAPAQPGRALPVFGQTPKSGMVKPIADAKPTVVTSDALTTNHSASVRGLAPGSRYLVSVSPAVGGAESEQLSFYTPPPPGKMMYLKLRVANVIFSNVTAKSDADKPGAGQPAPPGEIGRVRRECELATRFYWVNSGMRLYLQNDYYITDRPYTVPDDNWYGVGFQEGDEAALKQLVESAGRRLSDYDGRNFISMEKRWDAGGKKWTYPASGGGTIGPEEEPGYGKSAWKGGSNNAWLYAHEFGHQIDAVYHWSLGPEFLFNHFQPWDDTAHRHGEHYDGNAWLLREWAGYYTRDHQGWPLLAPKTWFRYFISRWGVVELVDDKDEDGIPDNAPNLPLDEVRFGSDPSKKDTDSDGLDDMQEALAREWVDYGLGEIWAGNPAFHVCDPRNPDSDGDGIPDGKDPYPLYSINPGVAEGPLQPDDVADDLYQPFAQFQDEAYECHLNLGWDEQNLYVGVRALMPPESIRIYLDFGDNGWYVGRDNYDLRVKPAGNIGIGREWHVKVEKTFGAALHNCGVPGKWPFYDADGLKDGEVKFSQSTSAESYSCRIAIPKNETNGVILRPGKKIGILLAVEPVGGAKRPGQTGQLTLWEPHTLFTFELVESQ